MNNGESMNYSLNPTLPLNQFQEMMKEQEKVAILSMLNATKAKISSEGESLSQKLDKNATEMKDFASKTVSSDLTEGLKGKSADAADDYLKNTVKTPEFKSPVKGL
jgi:hypothetical protein